MKMWLNKYRDILYGIISYILVNNYRCYLSVIERGYAIMRIMRSDDEQIVSAQGRYQYGQNNMYYNQQSNGSCAYDADVDFSYSGRQFMNELAKDRKFGTSNIRPVERDRDSFSERIYQDAIEEASRVKTMGYFNDLSKIEGTNPLHNTIPGRLREKASIHNQTNEIQNKTNVQKSNLNSINYNDIKVNDNINNSSYNNLVKNDFSKGADDKKIVYSEKMMAPQENNVMSFGNKETNISNMENMPFGNKRTIPPNGISNMGASSFQNNQMANSGISSSIAANINNPSKYDELMDKVRDNIQHEIETQLVEEGREKLREKVKVQVNNIPYKATKEYTGGSFGRQVAEQQLQVRDYKVDKSTKGDGESGEDKKMGILSWIILVPFMIVPAVGLIVSGVISFLVPKDKPLKVFARFCLTVHLVMSLVAVYMYFKGYLDISLIKKYINF